MKKSILKTITVLTLLALTAGLFVGCDLLPMPSAPASTLGVEDPYSKNAPVYITEVMTKNEGSITDADGEYSDWIEIHNASSGRISLLGYFLSDNARNPQKWEFPSVYIEAGAYMIIFASGKDKKDGELHTSFALSSTSGETITLLAPNGTLVNELTVGPSIADVSFGRVESGSDSGKYMWFADATPGFANSGNYASDINQLTFDTPQLRINEFMINNRSIIYDADGDYDDWVEIYNYGTEEIDLTGMQLSDDPTKPDKWKFPAVKLAPGAYLLVFASGKDKQTESELHTSFSLSAEDKSLLLSDQRSRKIDMIDFPEIPTNVSYGRSSDTPDSWLFFPRPTPGKENGAGFSELSSVIRSSTVTISEVMAAPPEGKDSDDYIKIKNISTEPIDLTGYGLSKNLSTPFAFTFGERVLNAGASLTMYAVGDAGDVISVKKGDKNTAVKILQARLKELNYLSGSVDGDFGVGTEAALKKFQRDNQLSASGAMNSATAEKLGLSTALFLPFKLSTGGEKLYITAPDGTQVDYFNTGKLRINVCAGRDSTGDRVFYLSGNSGTTYKGYTLPPVPSCDGGFVTAGTVISFEAPDGATLYYTTDGTDPTLSSRVLSGSYTVQKSIPLRVIACAPGLLPSDIITCTFLTDEKHDIPVFCITGDPAGYFSEASGIFAYGPDVDLNDPETLFKGNYYKNWERQSAFEFFETDGTKALSFNAGISIHGAYSRREAQKSIAVHLRDKYGYGEISYPFFRDNSCSTFEAFVLRMGGQDWWRAKLRDSFIASVIKDQANVVIMDCRPCALYINAEYYGLYFIREKINESYFENKLGIDPSNLDYLRANASVMAGSNSDYLALENYVSTHDMTDPDNYKYVCTQMDVLSYIDWWTFETWFVNTDTGNIKFFRDRDNGKWTWIIFDMDWAFYPTTYKNNLISKVYANGHGVGSMFHTTLIKNLLKNSDFKKLFLERYSFHVKNTLNPERLYGILNSMVSEIESEIPRQYERWKKPSVNTFNNNISLIKRCIIEKIDLTKNQMKSVFNLSNSEIERLFSVEYDPSKLN